MTGTAAQCGSVLAPSAGHQQKTQHRTLDVSEFVPTSMLQVHESHVERARFPVIDFHTHITTSASSESGVALASDRQFLGTMEELLAVMDRKHIRAMVNLTGGYEKGLDEAIARYDRAFPGRFYTFTEPCSERWKEPNYPQVQAQAIEQAHRQGARGLKILKTLGLYLRENITTGKLVKIDDPRFDPMWDACGRFNMPVAIHISDPAAFFTPADKYNERFEELNRHPDWSFHGHDYPSNEELIAARNRVIARHPKTQFMVLHVGNFAENLDNVSENLDRYLNMTVEIGARIGELGRQPRRSRKFFDAYPDRIMFGTDAVPNGDETPQQIFVDKL